MTSTGGSDRASVSFVYTGQPKSEIPRNVTHLLSQATEIPEGTFQDCTLLTEVEFGSSGLIKTIGKNAFAGCKSLVTMDLRNLGIQDIGPGAFRGCHSLANIHLPEEELVSITGRLFDNCRSLQEIAIPSSVVVISQAAFQNCVNLRNVRLLNEGGKKSSKLEVIGNQAFSGCLRLGSIADLLLPATIVTIGEEAFMGASSLTTLELPEGLMWLGKAAFSKCSNLRWVSIPSTVTRIEQDSFSYCLKLGEVNLREGLQVIGQCAFKCTSLSAIAFPRSLSLIENSAFERCGGLLGVEIPMNTDLRIVSGRDAQCFWGCWSLINVCIPTNMGYSADDAFSQSGGLLFEDADDDDDPVFVFRPDILRRRFVHLPIHEICYYASRMTVDDLSLALESLSAEGAFQSLNSITDAYGMTPFHIIVTSARLDGAMLAVLLDHMPMNIIGFRDKNGRTMMDYLLRHGSKRAVPLIKMVLQKVIQHEMSGLCSPNHAWLADLSHRVDEIPCDFGDFEDRKAQADSIMRRSTKYLGMEATSVVELAIWKVAIGQLPMNEQVDQNARMDCRMRCGSEIVLGNAMRYLWDHRRDKVPMFVTSLYTSLYNDAMYPNTAPSDHDHEAS